MTEDQPDDEFVEREDREVGVGPHPLPWPADARFDPELLEHGDRRNVADTYRYWSHEAIVADLDTRRHSFHVAIENWQHDLNIGTVVRTANAFNAEGVHIVGKKRWNRRGAMVTDKYMHVHHHENIFFSHTTHHQFSSPQSSRQFSSKSEFCDLKRDAVTAGKNTCSTAKWKTNNAEKGFDVGCE